MKKNILYLSIFAIYSIVIKIILYATYTKVNILTFMSLNIVLPSIIILILSFAVSYNASSTIKSCFKLAIIFAMIALAVNLVNNIIIGDSITNYYMEETMEEDVMEELYDELDKKAIEQMIEMGLIEEGEEVYSENFGGAVPMEEETAEGEIAYGEWDVEVTSESWLDTITSSLLDVLLAFASGVVAMKIWKKRKA